MVRIYYNLKVR